MYDTCYEINGWIERWLSRSDIIVVPSQTAEASTCSSVEQTYGRKVRNKGNKHSTAGSGQWKHHAALRDTTRSVLSNGHYWYKIKHIFLIYIYLTRIVDGMAARWITLPVPECVLCILPHTPTLNGRSVFVSICHCCDTTATCPGCFPP